VNGPYPAGDWPDLRIARDALLYCLTQGEKVLADGGYGTSFFVTPSGNNTNEDYRQSVVRARHETVNRRFKEFNILHRTFRHNRNKHSQAFWAVANIVQLSIEYENGLFDVEYYDDGVN